MKTEFIKQNVGVDISKGDFKVCFSGMTSAIDVVKLGSKTFDNNSKGFTSLLEWVLQKNKGNAELLPNFTLEATGVYYENLAYFLVEMGYTVHVVLPNQSKKYGQSLGARSKTDKIDAQILSQMGLERKLNTWMEDQRNAEEVDKEEVQIKKKQPGVDHYLKKGKELHFGYKKHILTDENDMQLSATSNEHDSKGLKPCLENQDEELAIIQIKAIKCMIM